MMLRFWLHQTPTRLTFGTMGLYLLTAVLCYLGLRGGEFLGDLIIKGIGGAVGLFLGGVGGIFLGAYIADRLGIKFFLYQGRFGF